MKRLAADGTPLCFGEFYDDEDCEGCRFYDGCEATWLDELADEVDGELEVAWDNDGAIDTYLEEE